jgi:energy-coupling factor transporter ATP-binding protein EcfA2
MIHFEHVTYGYPDTERDGAHAPPTLADLSLHISEGELVVVAGPSGSGKSTLLRCLNGLVPHFYGGRFAGHVRVAGLDTCVHEPRDLAATVGFVFQDPESQFVTGRVADEIAFGLENFNVPPTTMRLRVEEVLDQLGIAALRDRPVHTLSGGEKQRVAIAAALALRPRVLVLDEPTSQLDPEAAEEVLTALQRLNADLGLTIVLAEHRLERVAQFADRMVYLPGPVVGAHGHAPLLGPPRQVLRHAPLVPPLVELGRRLGWEPLPLTIKEGRAFLSGLPGGRRTEDGGQKIDLSPPSPPLIREGKGEGCVQRPFAVELEGVSFAYNGHPALRDVSLAVQPGEFVAIMGRNGSGKTTLLKHIIGLLRPDRGRVRVMGQDTQALSVADIARQVGYVPQNPGLLLFADSLRDELRFTLANHGLSLATAPIGLEALLARLGLAGLADTYPRDLSVGQRQRAALAAILITRPAVILLDEPTRGLDYAAKAELVALLKGWQAEGCTILMATHDVELVARAADRVVLLSAGQVVADGPARTVLTDSLSFAPQLGKLFGDPARLTVEDVLATL